MIVIQIRRTDLGVHTGRDDGRGQVGDGIEPDAHLHLSDQRRRGCSRYRRRLRRRRRLRLQQQLNSPIASGRARDL